MHMLRKDKSDHKLDVEVRAYDEGIAFRYFFPEHPAAIFHKVLSWLRNVQMLGGHNTIMDNMINLDFACKVTDVYLDRFPVDYVPYGDFYDPEIPKAPRDASAAGVVASALLELLGNCDAECVETYKDAAVKMLTSLSGDSYRSGNKRMSFLDHSTGHKPASSEIDASIIYADYYLEALQCLRKLNERNDVLATI